MATEAGLQEILLEGKKLFTADACQSIGNMYETAKLTMLRFYIATKAKDIEDDASETSEVVLVSTHSGSEISPVELVEFMDDFDGAHHTSEISVDSEITFGPVYNIEEEVEDTLIYEDFLMPTIPHQEEEMTITTHHADTFHDMITAFSDAHIMKKTLNVKRILPDNTEEAGTGSGVLRDVLSCFWHEFYERCTLGTSVKVPFIRHDFPAEKWKAIGRILLKGYQDCQYFPNKLALPFVEQTLFNCVYSDLKAHFLQEQEVLMQAVSDLSAVDWDDLVEVLDNYGCRRRITAEILPTILDEIAHKELVQKPMFVIDCWREITEHHLSLSPEALTKLFSDLQPTSKKVCQLLKFDENLTPKQKEVGNHLKRFIRELDENKLQKFLRFCTGSDLLVTDSILVEFQEMTNFTRRPVAHTCGKVLQISDNYENFTDFRSEFNAVLESNVWVMDIV